MPVVHSWSNEGWQHGGGEVSGPIVADPDGATIYHGAGHAAPWNPDQRLGDNRWTSSLFARDVKTGAVRWVDQLAHHDDFALGSTGALLPVNRDWHGTTRKLLIHPDRNGYVYVIDRTTGAVLSADAFTNVNETSGVEFGDRRDDPDRQPQSALRHHYARYLPGLARRDGWGRRALRGCQLGFHSG